MWTDSSDGSSRPPVLCACSRPRLVVGVAVRADARDGDVYFADVEKINRGQADGLTDRRAVGGRNGV